MSNLAQHQKSDAIKWGVVTVVILLIIATIVVGIGSSWFTNWNVKTWFGRTDETEQGDPDQKKDNGGAVVGNVTENGLALASARIASADYTDYGVSAAAETAYTLTATLSPIDAEVQPVDWSVEFVNASGSWSTGKTVTDYVTVSPTSDGALSAVVECKAAFAEKIRVKAALRGDDTVNATCSVDYKQRYVETYSVANYSSSEWPGMGAFCYDNKTEVMSCPNDTSQGFHSNRSVKAPTRYMAKLSSDYTIALEDQDVKYSYYVKLNPGFASELSAASELSDAKLASDWILANETTTTLATAKTEDGASSTEIYTVHDYMANLCSTLITALAPNVYYFSWRTLPTFIRLAKNYTDYHFQVKVVAELGGQNVETVHNIKFDSSTLIIPVTSIGLSTGGVVF